MKVKNVFENSSAIKNLRNYIDAKKEFIVSEPPKFLMFELEYDINTLLERNAHIFQRELQAQRLRKIAKSVMTYGYIVDPIIIDEQGKMVDGQHRIAVAIEMELTTIPVVIYQFKNHKHKARFFADACTPTGGNMAIMDRIDARRIAGYPYEQMLHKLIAEDPHSLFYDKVKHKKSENNRDKFTLPTFLRIFNWIGLGLRRKWEDGYNEFYQDTVKSMTDHNYIELRNRINNFATWLFSWAGTTKNSRPDLYREKILVGFMDFYWMMIHQAPNTSKLNHMLKQSIKRFKEYPLMNLMDKDITAVPGSILTAYNKNREEPNRLKEIDLGIQIPMLWQKK